MNRYASIPSQMGIQSSRRDDLESLGYVLLYLLRGGLPWQGMRIESRKAKNTAVLERKMEIPVEELCNGFPKEFET